MNRPAPGSPGSTATDPVLLGVAIGETEVRTLRANPEVLKAHWFKFASLRRVWQTSLDAARGRDAFARKFRRPDGERQLDLEAPAVRVLEPARINSKVRSPPMAILSIRIIGDPVLRTVAEEVTNLWPRTGQTH